MTREDKKIFNDLAVDKADRFRLSEQSIYNMNEGLIKRWNERVKPGDTVIHNGDFCFKSNTYGKGQDEKALDWEQQLNGKILFIKGNHDKNNSCRTHIHSLVLSIGGYRVNVVHNPEHAKENCDFNITGHVHNNWQCKRIRVGYGFADCINCGVDVWNFYPVEFEEIVRRLNRWRENNSLSL